MIVVGANYKRPLMPIYVVQSESHYSCLWARDASIPPPEILFEGERLPGEPEPDGPQDDDDEERPHDLMDGEEFHVCYFDQVQMSLRMSQFVTTRW